MIPMIDFMKKIIRAAGFDVRRYRPADVSSRTTLQGSLRTARSLGFHPRTIIDIGAARGSWSAEVAAVWPDARYILIDPLDENIPEIVRTCRMLRNAEYRIAAVTDHPGLVTLNVHPDLDGSSLFLEREENINGTRRQVAAITLDELFLEMNMGGPVLLKADVQGAEMQVLRGADQSLHAIDMILLEVLLFDIYQGKNSQIDDMIHFLKLKGFAVWDIFGMGYRMLDHALCQVDISFVRDDGLFRKMHQYATREQRLEQLSAIQKNNPLRYKKSD